MAAAQLQEHWSTLVGSQVLAPCYLATSTLVAALLLSPRNGTRPPIPPRPGTASADLAKGKSTMASSQVMAEVGAGG